jgi:hypothetical protein
LVHGLSIILLVEEPVELCGGSAEPPDDLTLGKATGVDALLSLEG